MFFYDFKEVKLMKQVEIEAKTVEEAIKLALKKLGAKKEEVDIEVINEGKMGLFGLMGATPAQVKVRLKDNRGQVKQQKEETSSSLQDKVKEILIKILNLMGIDAEVETSVTSERITANVKSSQGALLIGKKGQTLESLQLITSLIANKQMSMNGDNRRVRILLDTEGYRKRRESNLEKLAEQIATRVKETGKTEMMDPMPAQDRRIIHISIGDDPELDVVSEGEGIYRKIVIRKKK